MSALKESKDAYRSLPGEAMLNPDDIRIDPKKMGRRKAVPESTPTPAPVYVAPAPQPAIEYVDPWKVVRERARAECFPSAAVSAERIAAREAAADAAAEAHKPIARDHALLVADADVARAELAALDAKIAALGEQITNHGERQVDYVREGKPTDALAAESQTLKARRLSLIGQRRAFQTVARERDAAVKAHLPTFDESAFKEANARLQLDRERAKAEITAALEPVAAKMDLAIRATRQRQLEALEPFSGMHTYERLARSLSRDDLGEWFTQGIGMLLR